jgi:hypothetical protein
MDWSSFWFLVGFVSFLGFPLVVIPLIIELNSNKAAQRQSPKNRVPIQFTLWKELMPPTSEAEAEQRGFDWSFARAALQKKSYAMTGEGVSQREKDTFKAFMAHFAKHDPLYQQTIVRIKAALQQHGELLQSDMYKGQSDFDKEMARYILYFAEVLGDIKRVKKGRSYLVFLPEQIFDLDLPSEP